MDLSIAICPSTPLLVPELGGEAAAETADLREAAIAAVRTLPTRWLAIGVGEGRYGSDASGTFAGYGVDERVSLSSAAAPPTELPLPVLIAGWLRQRATADEVEARLVNGDGIAFGTALRRELASLEAYDGAMGVVVIADGANSLTDKAPGGYRPEAQDAQRALSEALTQGDAASLHHLPDVISGGVAYQVLAGLVGSDPIQAECLYRGSPYGVGYFAGTWRVS
ncbi:hypothetical protein FZI91_19650 [Mycobacterium sp. CBMA271]|uniref:hypothetical protein n=1 Tax=unclassified Mycobacteroides TaxID=2618759 RepID=UPI00132C4C8B|nr:MULTISPECIES: hypothetical protein [unclassified Mycobacteroides]MUM17268.1 hypothetical protein [Mycobacteroides sp. CBMA 326]MUM23900.1 hypothetical protein [Mycobacteroides sp. CBMA 271]